MKVAQLGLTLCNPMDYTVHGILQARILEWVAFPFSRVSYQPRNQTQVSCIAGWLSAEPRGKPKNTGVGSISLLPDPGIKPGSPVLQVDSLPAEPWGKPKNTGVGSISLLQRIFPTQESNWEISDWEISIILTCRSLIHSSTLSICYMLPYIQFLSQQMNFLIFLGSSL